MTVEEKNAAAEARRRRAFEEAVRHAAKDILEARLYGTVVFHAQAGLVVRVTTERSTKISAT